MGLAIPKTKTIRASLYLAAGDARFAEAERIKDICPSAAIYLAGYMIECHLKWALCMRSGVDYLRNLPDRKLADDLTSGRGHDLEYLSDVSSYSEHVKKYEPVRKAFLEAAKWSPNMRYLVQCGDAKDAALFLKAVKTLRDDIRSWANS